MPQFRLLEHPVLIALAASIGLVAARIRVGRGGALAAVAFFLLLRGGLALGIDGLGRVTPHFPLYVAEALLVEVLALVVRRDRQITFGALAGFAIGTVGFASEWAWSRAWMPFGWTSDLFPEALALAAVAGTAGGVLGGLIGRAVSVDVERQPTPRFAAAFAWVGAVAAIGISLPMTANRDWTADIRIEPVASSSSLANVVVRLDPADAAEGASWFHVLSWQGASQTEDGGSLISRLERQSDGSYRTTTPVPISGSAKTLLRLHTGSSLQSVPIYLPEDTAIPAEGVPAEDGVQNFVADKRVLQREARTDNVNLERAAYVLLALVAAGWMVIMSWGMRRLENPPSSAGGSPRTEGARQRPPLTSRTAPVT